MELNTVAKRIMYCRSILGYSRQEFVNEFGSICLKTLVRWENNSTNLPLVKLKKLVEFFKLKGLIVDLGWITTGNGIHPINQNLKSIDEYNFDDISYITLNSIKLFIKDFTIFQINSTFFDPMLKFGDYVGGVPTIDYKTLDGQLIILSKDDTITVGIFDYSSMSIKNYNGNTVNIEDSRFLIGKLIWMTKRF